MAAVRRIAFTVLSSTARSSFRAPAARLVSSPVTRPQPRQLTLSRPALGAVRYNSNAAIDEAKVYDFGAVKEISEGLDTERILIDVREPAELEGGYIPTAINIPIKSQPDALFLPEEEFVDRFGFSKPAQDKEVVFYCKSGVRSTAAARLAQASGYKNVAEYRGSWLDWQKQGGVVSGPWAA